MKTILGFAAILVTVCGMAACSDGDGENGAGGEGGDGRAATTTTSTTGGGDATGGDGPGGDATGGDGPGGATGGGGTGGDGASRDCAGEVGEACGDCCLEANRQGALALTTLMFQHCGCATDAPCAADCDTTDAATDVCADDGTVNTQALSGNVACVECTGELDAEAECIGDVAEACLADEGCSAYVLCARNCTEP